MGCGWVMGGAAVDTAATLAAVAGVGIGEDTVVLIVLVGPDAAAVVTAGGPAGVGGLLEAMVGTGEAAAGRGWAAAVSEAASGLSVTSLFGSLSPPEDILLLAVGTVVSTDPLLLSGLASSS